MRRADFDAAWRASDRIIASRAPGETCVHQPRHEQWVWDGRPLSGQRVLVRCYHGLGDTLQFARFLPILAELAHETCVWAQAPLIPLLRTLPRAIDLRFLPLHDGTPDVEYDVDVEIMELAHALRVRAEEVGELVPYFDVAPAQPLAANGFCAGVVLETGGWDRRRSLPRSLVDRLLAVPGLEVRGLQLAPPLAGVRNLSTPDVMELARRLLALDLVITPDTMVAHLAGALGVDTWTLLPADADWRWHQPRRTDSPWYPSMRLFRQRQDGDWDAVVNEVLECLAEKLS